jgi:pimeloyl-ACP methyl ester carboxylesterase
MSSALPVVLVPGLNCSARLYADQIPALWRFGPVTVADHTRDDAMSAIAGRILADAPGRFALVGLSMGGYIALELVRQAPDRVAKLALLDTSARADRPEQSARRDDFIKLAETGRFAEVTETLWPLLVHPQRHQDSSLKRLVHLMGEEVGPATFIRQENALKTRRDSRGDLKSIKCKTLVLVGEQDELTPLKLSQEIAGGISGANLVVIPDCGHLSSLECPGPVNTALCAWLEN